MENIHTYPEKDTLVEAGLEEKEALIYLAALKIGGGTISELASAMYMERSGIYYHIDKLVNLGLLETLNRGKHRVFLPTDPINLKKMVIEKQKRLDKLMPGLSDQFARKMNRSIIKYFQGKDEASNFYDSVYELISRAEKTDNEVMIIGNTFKSVSSTNAKLQTYKIHESQIDVRVKAILPINEKDRGLRQNKRDPYIVTRFNLPDAEIKFLGNKYAYPGAITICDNWVAQYDYKNMIYSITENQNMAETWKMFFRFIWDNLPNKS